MSVVLDSSSQPLKVPMSREQTAEARAPQPPGTPNNALMDNLFKIVTGGFAFFVLSLLVAILISLVIGSSATLREYGLSFIWTNEWNPVDDAYGGLVPIYGTLMSSLIALLIAVPVSFGIALFLTELAPSWLRRPLGTAIELLAAIPSIIYGMWGLFVFAPLCQRYFYPFLIELFGPIPGIGALFQGPPFGIGILTAGIILAVMIIPFIAAVMRDVFELVPPLLKESAYGVGATMWEVVWRVVLPYTKAGVIGGIMLGLGRALGETMAVTFVIGNSHRLSESLLAPGASIASTLANEFAEAMTPLHISALIELGLVLFLITSIVLALSKLLLLSLQRNEGKRT